MVYYARTLKANGDAYELDVFATRDGRDAWVAEPVPDESDDWELGPRQAIPASIARDEFEGDGYDWVTLHAGVRNFGRHENVPGWLELYDYGEQWNAEGGVDWSRDVTFVSDDWSAL